MSQSRSLSGMSDLVLALIGSAVLAAIGVLIWTGTTTTVVAAGAALAMAVLIAALSPAAGIVAVLAATPTMYDLHTLPWGRFSLLELATLAFAGGVGLRVLGWLLRGRWGKLAEVIQPPHVVVPVLLILSATAIAMVTLADPSRRAESMHEVRTVILEPIIFLAAARIAFRDPSVRNMSGAGFILIGAFLGAYGVLQTVLDFGGVTAGSVMRATGPYPHPNNLAFFLERTLLVTLGLLALRPRWWPVWILAAIQIAGVGATYSRGAFVAVAAGLGVVLLLRGLFRWLFGLMTVGAALLGGAFIVAPDRLIDAGGAGSEPTRFTIWRASLEMAIAHPVFGVGPDQFLYQYWRRYVEPMGWPERYTSHPHNLVLDIWLRLGVAGLAAFGSLLAGLVWWVRRFFASIQDDVWAMAAIGALVGGICHGLVDNGFFIPDLATITWFLVALLITAPHAVCPRKSI